MTNFFRTFILMVLASFLSAYSAFSEDCNRGTLDKAYCDRNFDQVADLPLDLSLIHI